jgi:hypothetical protein
MNGRGISASRCDTNGDGVVDMRDLINLFVNFTDGPAETLDTGSLSWIAPPGGGAKTFSVTASAPSWSVSSCPEWASCSVSGSALTLTVQANAGLSRKGSVSLKAGSMRAEIPVMQAGNLVAGGSQLVFDVAAGELCNVAVYAHGVTNFAGVEYVVLYDPAVFGLVDLCAFTKEKEITAGPIAGAGLTVSHVGEGEIRLASDKAVPAGEAWAPRPTTSTTGMAT